MNICKLDTDLVLIYINFSFDFLTVNDCLYHVVEVDKREHLDAPYH